MTDKTKNKKIQGFVNEQYTLSRLLFFSFSLIPFSFPYSLSLFGFFFQFLSSFFVFDFLDALNSSIFS